MKQKDNNQKSYGKIKITSQTLNDGTCLVAFQTAFPFDPESYPSILRILPRGNGDIRQEDGVFIGENRNKKSALVILAKPGDLIRITESCPRTKTPHVRLYKIGKDCIVMPLPEDVEYFSDDAIKELLVDAVPDLLPRWDQSWDSTVNYLALEWPTWFRKIVERQTRTWKRTNRALWCHLSPSSVDERELRRIVRERPYLALKLFKSRLDKEQLMSCIEECPAGGIEFAFDDFTKDQILYAASIHPDLLLRQADKLDDTVFDFCAHQSVESALEIKATLSSRRLAVVLSSAVSLWGKGFYDSLYKIENDEIIESLINHHEVWNRIYDGNYQKLYADLERDGVFDFRGSDGTFPYKGIRDILPESEKPSFDRFVAEHI